ncbi:MAG: DUF58 domain-containing protein [Polyangiaceae bacterium]|nr:DUF58 domain-containing protein [Polyangiaceae bacterium]MCW5790709.1 DUF58 domain-containing protein [Polyangiaceae bacterium]
MQIHPTRAAVDLTIAAILAVAAAVALRLTAVLAWAGALLLGLAIARAVTRIAVARIRAAGFEMLWREPERARRIARGERLLLRAEVRNRDTRAARYVGLRAVASPHLSLSVDPAEGEVPAGGRMEVTVTVTAPRVGRHGIHGLSLEVQGSPGLFEVPLTFANPYGIEVLPGPAALSIHSARGGRSRQVSESGRPGRPAGEGSELKELRELSPGDPFKRIAWKASARRGKLMVREYEQDERDVVWLILDASVELWSGVPGGAPLDLAIDEVAAAANRHLRRGDRVGLAICAARVLSCLPPASGPAQLAAIHAALAHDTATLDADRSDLDEADVALRVLEHLRPLDPEGASDVRVTELDRLARRAVEVKGRAPFDLPEPRAMTPRERVLRGYLAAFGMGSPPRQEPEQAHTDRSIISALRRAMSERPKPTSVLIWSTAGDLSGRQELEAQLKSTPRRGCQLTWVPMRFGPGLTRGGDVERAVADALELRAEVQRAKGERALRRLGVKVARPRAKAAPARQEADGVSR